MAVHLIATVADIAFGGFGFGAHKNSDDFSTIGSACIFVSAPVDSDSYQLLHKMQNLAGLEPATPG